MYKSQTAKIEETMEMNFKISDLDSILPIAGVDDGFIYSKVGDVTVGWELTLPVAYSVSEEMYDSMIRSLMSAVRGLPDWFLVHRQDLYFNVQYKAEERPGYLNQRYERYFDGRNYKSSRHFLYLTLSSKIASVRSTRSCGLFHNRILDSLPSPEELGEFKARAEEFITVVTSNGICKARRLNDEDLLGTDAELGLIESVMMLGSDNLSDVMMKPDQVKVNDSHSVTFMMASSEVLPTEISSIKSVESMSTANSSISMCFASPIGISLAEHPHINNLYIIKPNQQVVLAELATRIKRQTGFNSDGANAANSVEIKQYIDDANRNGLMAVYAHSNIISWSEDETSLLRTRSDISAAISGMGVDSVRNIHSAPVLWYSAIPGAGSELGKDHLMLCELRSALSLAQYESADPGLKQGAFKLTDRLRHIPVTLDLQKDADRANLVNNYNIFLDGASGTGKSFTTATLLYNMYTNNEHIFIIDIGGSYEQVCAVVNDESGGKDGIYNRWDKDHEFSFAPFALYEKWLDDDGILHREEPSLNFLISILMTIGSDAKKGLFYGEYEEIIIVHLIRKFIQEWRSKKSGIPIFDDFIQWSKKYLLHSGRTDVSKKGTMKSFLTDDGVRVDSESFNGEWFVVALSSYAKSGQFGFLLNTRDPADLFSSRFTVFDVGELSSIGNEKFFSLCVLCIVNAFDLKMNSRDISDFKVMALDEAWKAISNQTMAPYLRQLWKTARKFNTSAMVITQELDDILSSDIIKETILQNSDIKILMSQDGNVNAFEKISGPLGLSPMDVNLVLSMAGKESKSKDVFIKWGNNKSGVYTVEACPEMLWAFESNYQKKQPLFEKMKQTGSMLTAIDALVKEDLTPK